MFSTNRTAPSRGALAEAPWDQRLARALIRPLAGSPVTPNHITAVSLIAGLTGALLFAQGGAAMHWGALLFVLSTLLDHADGELARMTGQTSKFGHVFDIITGGSTHVALFFGIGFGLQDTFLDAWAVSMGVATGLVVAAIFALRFEVERRNGKARTEQPSFAGFEVEDVMYLIAPITWLGGLVPFLVLAAIGAPAFLIYQAWEFHARRA